MRDAVEVVIDRAKWARGGRQTGLLNGDGSMCCLGFASKALGYSDKELYYCAFPTDLICEGAREWNGMNVTQLSQWQSMAVNANDNANDTEENRELRVRSILEDHGFKVSFVGEGMPLGDPCEF